jgi:archaellin
MGKTKRAVSEVFEKLKERAKEVKLNIRVEKKQKVKGKVRPCTGTETLYRTYVPYGE